MENKKTKAVTHRKIEHGDLATYLTPAQAATKLGLSRPAIYAMIKKGQLPAALVGGQYFISPTEVEALLRPRARRDGEPR